MALAGPSLPRDAALLLAVAPSLGGLLVYGARGAGKSAVLDGLLNLTGWPAAVAIPGTDAEIRDYTICHHFDLQTAAGQARCFQSRVLLAAADQLPPNHDRFGLIVHLPAAPGADERHDVLEAHAQQREDTTVETELLRREIVGAADQLSAVTMTELQVRALSDIATALCVEGNRADYFAALAARANAALDGRTEVDDGDLELAVKLVLAPRARALPPSQRPGEAPPDVQPAPGGDSQSGAEEVANDGAAAHRKGQDFGSDDTGQIEEVLIGAAWSALPPALLRTEHGRSREVLHGRLSRVVPVRGRRSRLALGATLQVALPWQRVRGRRPGERLRITKTDLRRRLMVAPPSVLHLVVFDASGSMASNRMAEAKGAVQMLLRRAYVSRNRVALIAFRRREAMLLLPPTRSLARARQALDRLPSGGGTPLAEGLELALRVVAQARRQVSDEDVRLILVTDGRAPEADWPDFGRALANLGVQVTLVDTRSRFSGLAEAASLARQLGAIYTALPGPARSPSGA